MPRSNQDQRRDQQNPDQPQNQQSAPNTLAQIQAKLVAALETRSIDGSSSHETNIDWGSVGQQMLRLTECELHRRHRLRRN